jgi:hypothetical protein
MIMRMMILMMMEYDYKRGKFRGNPSEKERVMK